jgi:hypothetical protein
VTGPRANVIHSRAIIARPHGREIWSEHRREARPDAPHLTPASLDSTIRLLDNRPIRRPVGDNLETPEGRNS